MSLALSPEEITAVLLSDGWYRVNLGTFSIDSYEYVEGDLILHGGGESGITSTGFVFEDLDRNAYICGPLTAIQAVEVRKVP